MLTCAVGMLVECPRKEPVLCSLHCLLGLHLLRCLGYSVDPAACSDHRGGGIQSKQVGFPHPQSGGPWPWPTSVDSKDVTEQGRQVHPPLTLTPMAHAEPTVGIYGSFFLQGLLGCGCGTTPTTVNNRDWVKTDMAFIDQS